MPTNGLRQLALADVSADSAGSAFDAPVEYCNALRPAHVQVGKIDDLLWRLAVRCRCQHIANKSAETGHNKQSAGRPRLQCIGLVHIHRRLLRFGSISNPAAPSALRRGERSVADASPKRMKSGPRQREGFPKITWSTLADAPGTRERARKSAPPRP